MTDDDLLMLHREEVRLYSIYVTSLGEESRYPLKTAKKREEWVKLHEALLKRLGPDERRRIIRAAVDKANEGRKKR